MTILVKEQSLTILLLLTEISVPEIQDHQLVKYQTNMPVAKKMLHQISLENQRTVLWYPWSWFQSDVQEKEIQRKEKLAQFKTDLKNQQYQIITRENKRQILSIIENLFGPLEGNPSPINFRHLDTEQIFRLLATFYEYKKNLKNLTVSQHEFLVIHFTCFLPSVSASNVSVNVVALDILNESVKTLFNNLNPNLEQFIFQIYRERLVNSNKDAIRIKAYTGLSLLGKSLLYTRVKISLDFDFFKHLPEVAQVGNAIFNIINLFFFKKHLYLLQILQPFLCKYGYNTGT